MKSCAVLAAALSLSLTSVAARAQAPGDTVRIETAKGAVEGTLVDRLPQGYLVNKGKTSVVVPYLSVLGITKLAPAPLAPMTVPAAPVPAAAPAKGAKAPPQTQPSDTFSGFAVDPAPVEAAPAGAEPPPPPPPPPVPAQFAPPPVMVPIPALPAPPRSLPPPKLERRSKVLMGTGVAMVGLGAIAVITGIALIVDGSSQSETVCDYYTSGQRCYTNPNREPRINAGRITMLAGATVGVIGIPLWSIGGKKVPVKEPPAEVSAIPGGAALTLRF